MAEPAAYSESFLHEHVLDFGKHKGTRLVRVPAGYLLWLANTESDKAAMAQAELDRRGTTRPDFDISGHAIDRASQSCLSLWQETRHGNEGLHAWLCRLGAGAVKLEPDEQGRVSYAGILWGFDFTLPKWPVLKTVRRDKRKEP